jgi:hypothetical protein
VSIELTLVASMAAFQARTEKQKLQLMLRQLSSRVQLTRIRIIPIRIDDDDLAAATEEEMMDRFETNQLIAAHVREQEGDGVLVSFDLPPKTNILAKMPANSWP